MMKNKYCKAAFILAVSLISLFAFVGCGDKNCTVIFTNDATSNVTKIWTWHTDKSEGFTEYAVNVAPGDSCIITAGIGHMGIACSVHPTDNPQAWKGKTFEAAKGNVYEFKVSDLTSSYIIH